MCRGSCLGGAPQSAASGAPVSPTPFPSDSPALLLQIKTDMYDYFHGTAPPATPAGAGSPAADHRDHSMSALGGPVAPDDAARRLLERVWEIDLESTGRFVDEEGAALPY